MNKMIEINQMLEGKWQYSNSNYNLNLSYIKSECIDSKKKEKKK